MARTAHAILWIFSILAAHAVSPAQAVVSGNYYEDTVSFFCHNHVDCVFSFPTMPQATAGYVVVLDRLSCEANVSTGLGQGKIYLTDNGLSERRPHFLTMSPVVGPLSFSEPLHYMIAGGPPRAITIRFYSRGTANIFQGTCTVVGLIQPN